MACSGCQGELEVKADTGEDSDDNNSPEIECEVGEDDVEGFVKVHLNLTISDEEFEKSLHILHQGTGDLCKTSASHWTQNASTAAAVYKVFKIKQWLLTKENLIFDPLKKDKRQMRVKAPALQLHKDDSTGKAEEEIDIKSLSVDGIFSRISDQKRDNLKKLDELLDEIDGSVIHDGTPDEFLESLMAKAIGAHFIQFIYCLLHAMVMFEAKERIPVATFRDLFAKFFSCISTCLNEDAKIGCDSTMDGLTLDTLELPILSGTKMISVTSKPDLFIYQRTNKTSFKKVIAVVEVKGKHGDRIIHCDEDDDCYRDSKFAEKMEAFDKEVEVEHPLLEKIKWEHRSMKKIQKPEKKKAIGKFLPELIAGMLCCNDKKSTSYVKRSDPGYSFGVAFVGFHVYFVSLQTSGQHGFKMTFMQPDLFTHAFVTRSYNLLVKNDRRIIIKVLAAACYIDDTLEFLNGSE